MRYCRVRTTDGTEEVLPFITDMPSPGDHWRYRQIVESSQEVDIRPVHQEPCEWELSDAPGRSMTNLEALNNDKHKFCPECGRRLEEK